MRRNDRLIEPIEEDGSSAGMALQALGIILSLNNFIVQPGVAARAAGWSTYCK